MPSRISHRFAFFALLAAAVSPVCAQTTVTWTGATDTTFSTGSNWSGGIAPANNITSNIARFTTGGLTPVLTANRSVAGLVFADDSGSATTLSASGGAVLTLGSSGLTAGATTGPNLTVVSANLAGTGGISLVNSALTDGTGFTRLTLSGNNTFSGGISFAGSGTTEAGIGVLVGSATALGTGAITVTGSGGSSNTKFVHAISNAGSSALTLTTNNAINLSATTQSFGFNLPFAYSGGGIDYGTGNSGAGDLNLGTGGIAIGVSVTSLYVGSGNVTIGGVISGGTNTVSFITTDPTAAFVLNGANTFTGQATISGKVFINSIADKGVAQSLGASAVRGIFFLGAGGSNPYPSLIYTGPTASSNKPVTIATGGTGATIDGSGTGPVTFTGAFDTTGAGKPLNLTGSTAGNAINASVFSGSALGMLTKNGTGSWSSNLPVAGGVTVNAGTLTLSAGTVTGGGVTVNGGTLSFLGNGTVTGDGTIAGGTLAGAFTMTGLATVQSGASLSPGNNVGTMTFNSGLTLDGGSILNFDLGTTSDLIAIAGGTLTGPSSGTVTLNFGNSGGFGAGTYALVNYTTAAGTSNFSESSFTLGSTVSGYNYALGLSGNTLQLTASAIPEPSTYAAIFGAAALGFAVWRRRRGAAAAKA